MIKLPRRFYLCTTTWLKFALKKRFGRQLIQYRIASALEHLNFGYVTSSGIDFKEKNTSSGHTLPPKRGRVFRMHPLDETWPIWRFVSRSTAR